MSKLGQLYEDYIYWPLYNIRVFIKHLFRFPRKVYNYLPLIWNDCDNDYEDVLVLMRFKLGLLRKHIAKHNHFVGSDEVAKEILKAEEMIEQCLDYPPSFDDEDLRVKELFDYLRDNIQRWWC